MLRNNGSNRSPYGLEISDSCLACKSRPELPFCNLPEETMAAFNAIKFTSAYPKSAVLFVEGQAPRGIYLVCSGHVKLSTGSSDGRTLIMNIADPGEVLGLSATISGNSYEMTAETIDPSIISFVKREDFQKFISEHSSACLKVALQLSQSYFRAYEQIRSLGLSHSAMEKLARLLLEWSIKSGEETKQGIRIKLALTHEEISQMIGTSRETVTRMLGELRNRQLIHLKGSNLVIKNRRGLESLLST